MLKILKSIVAGGGRREQHYPTLRRMLGTPRDNLGVVVFY